MGSDDEAQEVKALAPSFNPRSHMGSDLILRLKRLINFCFNPRSHMGSDKYVTADFSHNDVSIHAPTWGALLGFLQVVKLLLFQSTLPHGERLKLSICSINIAIVSIHAPTWGATNGILFEPKILKVSIHAPTWGATLATSLIS